MLIAAEKGARLIVSVGLPVQPRRVSRSQPPRDVLDLPDPPADRRDPRGRQGREPAVSPPAGADTAAGRDPGRADRDGRRRADHPGAARRRRSAVAEAAAARSARAAGRPAAAREQPDVRLPLPRAVPGRRPAGAGRGRAARRGDRRLQSRVLRQERRRARPELGSQRARTSQHGAAARTAGQRGNRRQRPLPAGGARHCSAAGTSDWSSSAAPPTASTDSSATRSRRPAGDLAMVVSVREPLDLAGRSRAKRAGTHLHGARRDPAPDDASADGSACQLVRGGSACDHELLSHVQRACSAASTVSSATSTGSWSCAPSRRHEPRTDRALAGEFQTGLIDGAAAAACAGRRGRAEHAPNPRRSPGTSARASPASMTSTRSPVADRAGATPSPAHHGTYGVEVHRRLPSPAPSRGATDARPEPRLVRPRSLRSSTCTRSLSPSPSRCRGCWRRSVRGLTSAAAI